MTTEIIAVIKMKSVFVRLIHCIGFIRLMCTTMSYTKGKLAGSRPGTGIVKLNNVMSERYIFRNRYRWAANQIAGKKNSIQGKNTKDYYGGGVSKCTITFL